MRIVTERELRRTIADRWLAKYRPICESWGEGPWIQVQQGERLQALGVEPTLDQIAEVIGQEAADHWARTVCYQCRRSMPVVVEFEANIDEVAEVCTDCLQRAVKLMEESFDILHSVNEVDSQPGG